MANAQMQQDFVDGHDNRVPLRKSERRVRADQVKKRRKPIKTQSQTQAKREAFLAGIKATLILSVLLNPRSAIAHLVGCSRCSRGFDTFDEAWAGLDLHHSGTKRSHGKGYRGGKNFGVDDPRNLELVCKPCHRKLESNPEWSGAS